MRFSNTSNLICVSIFCITHLPVPATLDPFLLDILKLIDRQSYHWCRCTYNIFSTRKRRIHLNDKVYSMSVHSTYIYETFSNSACVMLKLMPDKINKKKH